jgi:hypothetical protein
MTRSIRAWWWTRAAEAAVVATAYAAVQPPQVEAERFMRENGADASTHGPVGRAGRAGDPDVESDASDRP